MKKLTDAKVYRAGVTAARLTHENGECDFEANSMCRSLDFRFELDSKGGGRTQVLLRIGIRDLATILREIAREMPENAGILCDSAAIASKNNLESLVGSKNRARSIVSKLEKVAKLASEIGEGSIVAEAVRVGVDEAEALVDFLSFGQDEE